MRLVAPRSNRSKNWIITAGNAGEIAVSGSLQEKKALALKMLGSNLVLDCKRARGSCVKPSSLIPENSQTVGIVGPAGFESHRVPLLPRAPSNNFICYL